MGMLTAYLKRHRGTVLLWAAVCAVFLLTFRLYHLPLGAVGYGAALSGTLGLLCFLSGFRRYRKKMPDAPAGGRASGGRTGISGALRGAGGEVSGDHPRPSGERERSGKSDGGAVCGSGGCLYGLGPSDQDAHCGHAAETFRRRYQFKQGNSGRSAAD